MILTLGTSKRTINLIDGTNYMIEDSGWAPAIPARVPTVIGGREPHEEPTAVMQVHVFGSRSAEGALDNLADLIEFLWVSGESFEDDDGDPVLMTVAIGDDASPMQAMVLGKPDSGDMISFSASFIDDLISGHVTALTIAFKRRAGLLTRDEVAIGKTVVVGAISTVDFGVLETAASTYTAPDMPSPTTFYLTNLPAQTAVPDIYLLITGESETSQEGTNFKIATAADMSSTEFASTNDSANNALDDDIMRIDAASDQTGEISINGISANSRRVALYVAVRNNSATTTWRVRCKTSGTENAYSQWVEIDASTLDPQIISIGEIVNRNGWHVDFALEFETDDSTGTLDLNYAVIFPVGADSTEIFIEGDGQTVEYEQDIIVDPRALTHETGLVSRTRTRSKQLRIIIPAGESADIYYSVFGSNAALSWDVNGKILTHPGNLNVVNTGGPRLVITLLSAASDINELIFASTNVENIAGLGALENAQTLTFDGTDTMTWVDLEGMEALTTLTMNNSQVAVVRFGDHPNFVSWFMDNSQVTELSFLGLSSLITIYIRNGVLATVTDVGDLVNVSALRLNGHGMSQGQVDDVIDQVYAARANYLNATPYLNIGGSNAAPSGIYQYAATPSTGLEKVYALVNDDDAEGFNTWTVVYS